MKKISFLGSVAAVTLTLSATLALSSCAGSSPSVSATASATKDAGAITKDLFVCFTNKSTSAVKLEWVWGVDTHAQSGMLPVGQTYCALGSVPKAILTFPDTFQTAVTGENPFIGAPSLTFTDVGPCDNGSCAYNPHPREYASAGYAEGETVGSDVEGHQLSAKRQANTDVINFAISILN